MNLTDLALFLAATEAGSLAGAARRSGTSALQASRRIAALEQDMGIRLFHRTTRALTLTDEGERFLPYARTMIDAQAEARAALGLDGGQVTGTLRLTASLAFGRKVVTPALIDFLKLHPQLEVNLVLSDDILDMVVQGLDLAIRVTSRLRDSSLVARRLADNPRGLYASPSYLGTAGTPLRLAELAAHDCLPDGSTGYWTFRTGERTIRQKIGGRLSTHSIDAIHQACTEGAGIALLSEWDVKEDLASGKLVPVPIADAKPEPMIIVALYPSARLLPSKVRLFIDYMHARLMH
jgi:DNA-binding transcriptional LysR family regulator